MGRILVLVAAVAAALGLSGADRDEPFNIKSHYTKYEYQIPMRDGARLFTSVYVPKAMEKSYPILMMRTPYGVAPYGPDRYPDSLFPGDLFARDGFIFVYQDVRGRWMSEGKWLEMTPEHDPPLSAGTIDESTDTYDTIDWLIHHVLGNSGKVGLAGISYPGFYASAGLINAHPALVAVSPQAPVSDLYAGDDAFHNGAFFLAANFGFYTFFHPQDHPQRPKHDPDFDLGTNDGYQFYLNLGSVSNAEEKYFKYRNSYWTEMVAHPNQDQFWDERNVLPHLKQIKPAVLIVGGWFDAEDLSGTLKTYRAIRRQSPQTAASLVMGPWSHGGWSSGDGSKLGDIDFASKTAEFFRREVQLPFFRHYLKDAPAAASPQALVFETGKNQWLHYEQWPPAGAQSESFYLRAGGKLSREAPGTSEEFDEYISDPARPVPYYETVVRGMAKAYMTGDQRFAQRRPDVLSYVSEPLTEDVTVAGPAEPALTVSSSGTDSDFIVKLIDVYPDDFEGPEQEAAAPKLDGYEQLVRGEPFRAKFRESFRHPKPLEPNQPVQIRFAMPDINHCFRRDHRIMVQIQSSWFPLVDRNPQIFTDIFQARSSDFRRATERIYHSKTQVSAIRLSVLAAAPDAK